MKLTDYFKRRAVYIKTAQERKDRLDSGEADASWPERLQSEFNMDFIERLEAIEALLAPPVPEPPSDPLVKR